MIGFPVALQLYSVRDDMAADFEGTLKRVKELGFDGVEFAGLYGKSAAEVKQICREIGLDPISAHVPFVDLMKEPENLMREYAEIGCNYVVIPYLMPEFRPGGERFTEVIEGAKFLGAEANKRGMTLLYHNHDFEFKKIDGEYALDILYSEVSADLLKTELDTCWINVGGENPSEYIKKYSGRTPVVHLKDFVMPGKKPEKMYALIGIDDGAGEAEEAEAFGFRPLGKGVQNFSSILAAAKESGAEWVVVEQDQPSLGLSPMECAEMSMEYLKTL